MKQSKTYTLKTKDGDAICLLKNPADAVIRLNHDPLVQFVTVNSYNGPYLTETVDCSTEGQIFNA